MITELALSLLMLTARPDAVTVSLIQDACDRYELDCALPLAIAQRETHQGDDYRTHAMYTYHRGVYQFNRITWEEQAPLCGWPTDWDLALDDYVNIDVALCVMSRGQWWRWGF